ncbi:MAG: SulP family inorganic anion transporter [Pseudomonadota bacterium]
MIARTATAPEPDAPALPESLPFWLVYLLRPLAIFRAARRRDLLPDLLAGFTVAAVAIPQAIGYAVLAELPPSFGLYTAATAAIVGALWGSSRVLATGPTNATSLLVLYMLLPLAAVDTPRFLLAASALAVITGVFRIALALLRFGAIITLTSRSVLLGFTSGAAVLIVIGQLRNLLCIPVPFSPDVLDNLRAIAQRLPETHVPSLVMGLGTAALIAVASRLGKRIPGALLALVAAAIAVPLLGLDTAIRVVGEVPRSLPPLTWTSLSSLPDLELIRQLVIPAMAVSALGLVEAVAAAQTLGRQRGERMDSNQEFFGQGLANVVAGLFSGYPCSGSLTRSSLNHTAGARSSLSSVFTGLILLTTLLVLAPLASHIPRPALAGVLLVVAWNMFDVSALRRVFRTSRAEGVILAATFVATLTLPLEFAILSGVLFSLAYFVLRSSLPRVYPVVPEPTFRHFVENPGLPVCPQVGILNIRGPLFFGAVHHVEEALKHNLEDHPGQSTLVLRMHGVEICDLTGVDMLEATARHYRDLGGDLFLVRPHPPVLNVLRSSGFLAFLGEDHILKQEDAVEHLFEHSIDPQVCAFECEHRVFAECQAIEKHSYDEKVAPHGFHHLDPDLLLGPYLAQQYIDTVHPVLVDVREPVEHQRARIPGSSLLPLRELLDRFIEIPQDRPVLLYCRSGRRSARAMHILQDLGYSNVHALQGGILAWRAAGRPFEEGGMDTRPASPATALD